MDRGYRVTAADPFWAADDFTGALERGVAIAMKAQGVATQTAYDAFRNGLTAAQAVTVVQRILDCVKCSVP